MSKQEEIIEVAGKKVVVRYTRDGQPCEKCVLDGTKGCDTAKCSQLDRVGMEIDERAYFADPRIRCSDCALFLGGKCTRPGGECARKAPLSEEIHSLREWAQILATNPDLRAEFDKLCPPQPIQGSIAPEADLEAEIETYFKGWYMDETDQGYILHTPDDHAGLMSVKQVARHFAEWGRTQKPSPQPKGNTEEFNDYDTALLG